LIKRRKFLQRSLSLPTATTIAARVRFDPDYYDGKNGNVATLIGQDLVQVVKSRYRTLEEPEFWAIGGISSGGWGAFNIGLRRLNHFNILFSHTGYFTDDSGAVNSPQSFI
jgi:enterochelin esterase-like enzyme